MFIFITRKFEGLIFIFLTKYIETYSRPLEEDKTTKVFPTNSIFNRLQATQNTKLNFVLSEKQIDKMFKFSIPQNLKLDKKFKRRKHDIFQLSNLKKQPSKSKSPNSIDIKEGQNYSIFSYLNHNLNKEISLKIEDNHKIHPGNDSSFLPNINLYSRPKQKKIIPIENSQEITKEISMNLNFINKKITVLNMDILAQLKQQTKAVPYNSEAYSEELKNLNRIFSGLGINLKVKDILLSEGVNSKTKFAIFTNHPKHPYSLCCKAQIVIKHIDFLSLKYFNFQISKSQQKERAVSTISRDNKKSIKSLISIACLQCGQEILKIKPDNSNIQQNNNFQASRSREQKRLLNYSKLISSGRFKNTLINDQSVTLMISRNLNLDRSKSVISNIKQLEQQQIKRSRTNFIAKNSKSKRSNKRYHLDSIQNIKINDKTSFDRQKKVKSEQTTLSMKVNQNNTDQKYEQYRKQKFIDVKSHLDQSKKLQQLKKMIKKRTQQNENRYDNKQESQEIEKQKVEENRS